MNEEDFKDLIWQKARELYRDMPWRDDTRAYYVLVSELMLQQTQVDRVRPKFMAFIERFPDEKTLAASPLSDVLALWNGLGYNRRAKYLHEAAKKVVGEFGGTFPQTFAELQTLPGVGPGTAGALAVYAFNQPVVFIETNVRTVYFHHFFPEGEKVSDAELRPLIETTLSKEHPREFYWALMDYGSWLKRQGAGSIRTSKHYKKQSRLEGSLRQTRGQIVKLLVVSDLTKDEIKGQIGADERFEPALAGLMYDGLVKQTQGQLHLTK